MEMREETSSSHPNKKNKTRIQDLPDECLSHILSLVGDLPLPLRTSALTRVKHPLQCASVCRRWRALAPSALRSLSLNVNVPATAPFLSRLSRNDLSLRFPNLEKLTLTHRVVRLPSALPLADDLLAALSEHLAPQLRALEILFPITSATLPLVLRLLAACRGLRSLRATVIRQDGLLAEKDALSYFDVVRTLPQLAALTLNLYGAPSPALWEAFGGSIPNVREVFLRSDSVPPAAQSVGRLPDVLRELSCVSAGEQELDDLCALGQFTALESLELRHGPGPVSARPSFELRRNGLKTALAPESLRPRNGSGPILGDGSLVSSDVDCSSGSRKGLGPILADGKDCILGLGCLSRLRRLTLSGMAAAGQLLSGTVLPRLRNLEALAVVGCAGFQGLPESVGDLRKLRSLSVQLSGGEELPDSLTRLTSLRDLHVTAGRLRALPGGLGGLTHLRSLRLSSCSSLRQLPACLFGSLVNLEELEIAGCSVAALPEGIGGLVRLKFCALGLPEAEGLPESVGGWCALEKLVVECPKISRLPEGLCGLGRLQVLSLHGCRALTTLPEGIRSMSSLVYLGLRDCPLLSRIPENLGCLVDRDSIG